MGECERWMREEEQEEEEEKPFTLLKAVVMHKQSPVKAR